MPCINVLRCATVHAVPPSPLLQVAALAPDELVGDNQYFCDFCAAKSDADRRMRLRSLPPYLCLALQRFTYDHQVRAELRGMQATAMLCRTPHLFLKPWQQPPQQASRAAR